MSPVAMSWRGWMRSIGLDIRRLGYRTNSEKLAEFAWRKPSCSYQQKRPRCRLVVGGGGCGRRYYWRLHRPGTYCGTTLSEDLLQTATMVVRWRVPAPTAAKYVVVLKGPLYSDGGVGCAEAMTGLGHEAGAVGVLSRGKTLGHRAPPGRTMTTK